MHEWVSLHIGQAGCQIGDVTWQLFCQEQGIGPDGIPKSDEFGRTCFGRAFFAETSHPYERVTPRTLFVDTQPSLGVDHNPLYASQSLLSGTSGAGNIFARGKNLELAKRAIERFAMPADNLNAFNMLYAFIQYS